MGADCAAERGASSRNANPNVKTPMIAAVERSFIGSPGTSIEYSGRCPARSFGLRRASFLLGVCPFMNQAEVLLVEDNAGDALLIGQALAESPITVRLHIARDGEQALQIMGESDFKPDLIILDLN